MNSEAKLQEALENQKSELEAEIQANKQKNLKKRYRTEVEIHKVYRLKKDIYGKPKEDGKQYISHSKGNLYEQNPLGTNTIQFKYVVGDPEYFDYVEDKIVKNAIYLASKGAY